jgi:hypothetical protein
MQSYQPRKVEFRRIVSIDNWKIKVYTLTYKTGFEADEVLENALANLPEWLEITKTLDFETYKIAFLMVHEGRDGVWCILSWWLGENMLRSVTFGASLENPNQFEMLPKEGGMVCVWELEIVDFERKMWIECILKKAEKPDFAGYLEQRIDGYF